MLWEETKLEDEREGGDAKHQMGFRRRRRRKKRREEEMGVSG